MKVKKDHHHQIITNSGKGIILNLLLVVPRLLKFSRLAQFLTPEDENHFNITHKKENVVDLTGLLRRKKENTPAGS